MNPLTRTPDVEGRTYEELALPEGAVDGVRFRDCTFVACSLPRARLTHCRFLGCRFTRCDLGNAVLTGSTFRDVTFDETKLVGIDWTAADLCGLTFTASVLDYGVFAGLDLRKTALRQCQARHVDLEGTNLTESIADDTDFDGARFHRTNLTRADWRGACNYALRPADNTLKKTRLALPEAIALLYGLDIELDD